MIRLLLAFLLLAASAAADVSLIGYTTGLGDAAVYVLFDDDTAAPMVEGSGLQAGTYTAADAALVTATLGSGTYSATIRLGDYASPSAADEVIGVVGSFVFDGTNEVAAASGLTAQEVRDALKLAPSGGAAASGSIDDQLGAIPSAAAIADAVLDEPVSEHETAGSLSDELSDAKNSAVSAATTAVAVAAKLPTGGKVIAGAGDSATDLDDISLAVSVTAETVADSRTWRITNRGAGYRAQNIVTVAVGYTGPLQLDLSAALNARTGVETVTSVASVPSITFASERVSADRERVLFDAPELDTAGTYVVTVKVATSDTAALPILCTLRVVEE